MEFGALLLGLEPTTALVAGCGTLLTAGAAAVFGNSMGKTVSEGGKAIAKTGLMLGMDAYGKVEGLVSETGQGFSDLVAEAKAELKAKRTS